MRRSRSSWTHRAPALTVIGFIALALSTSRASAQTTVVLDKPESEIVSATNRGGSYANSSLLQLLTTRAADSLEYRRGALPKFDPRLTVVNGATSSSDSSTASSASSTGGSTLRVLQWNTHHGGVRTDGKLDTVRLVKKAASLKPDVVSFNEVERYTAWGHNDGPAVMAALMKRYTGRHWYFKFATATGSATGNGNLVMSRFRIESSQVRLLSYDRSAVDVVVHVNGRDVHFTSTHLDADSSARRLTQIGELVAWARTHAEPRIIAGDFNAKPGSSENAKMKSTYYDSWAEAQADGTAIGYNGNSAGNTRRSRIDYIYYSRGAKALTLRSSQVFDVRDSSGVMPSDHRPVLTVFTVN
jgi:endonuclease/exonuclease/phosphatase family metal-dependent hydrolase